LRFIGDIPIARSTLDRLRELGHQCVHCSQVLDPKASDGAIIELAARESAIVLCFDIDLPTIVARSGHPGPTVVLFRTTRQSAPSITARLERLLDLIEAESARGALITVEDDRVRVRRLPIRE
jgi:predicted nuclease of predicted toxin-antitoxin system